MFLNTTKVTNTDTEGDNDIVVGSLLPEENPISTPLAQKTTTIEQASTIKSETPTTQIASTQIKEEVTLINQAVAQSKQEATEEMKLSLPPEEDATPKKEEGMLTKFYNWVVGEKQVEEAEGSEIVPPEFRGVVENTALKTESAVEEVETNTKFEPVIINNNAKLQLSESDQKLLNQYEKVISYIKGSETSGIPQLEAYICAAGKVTIGYGTTAGVASAYGIKIEKNSKITVAQAEQLFAKETTVKIKAIEKIVPENTPQHVKDALLSLSYNVGVGGITKSKFFEQIKKGDFEAAQGLMNWVNVSATVPSVTYNKKTGKMEPLYKITQEKPQKKELDIKIQDPRTKSDYSKYKTVINPKTKKKEYHKLTTEQGYVLTAGLVKRRVQEMVMLGDGKLSKEGIALIEKLEKRVANSASIKKKEELITYLKEVKENPQKAYETIAHWNKFYQTFNGNISTNQDSEKS